jgi:sugar/nucleoside kinase (ribokinase family)
VNRKGIVLSGTVILDIVHMVDHWPEQESVAFVSRSEYGAGGPPHNAAAGLMRLGADFPVTLQGVVGDDAYGAIFCEQARSYGLSDQHIRRLPNSVTSHTQVMTTIGTGRRTFFHQPGVNAVLAPDMLLPTSDAAKIFYLGSPGIAKNMDDHGHWADVLRAAKARGFITALEMVPLETSILQKHVPQLLPLVDYFVVNDHEAASVTGMSVTNDKAFDWDRATQACHMLLDRGVAKLAAIHHPDGAVAVGRTQGVAKAHAVNIRPDEIIGTVGAGDAFFAGVLFGLHEDWPLDQCLALGNATAATSLFSPTTSASIRPWKECLAFAKERGLRG